MHRDGSYAMIWIEHPIEFDLDASKGQGYIVVACSIPAIAIIVFARIALAGVAVMSPITATNIVELVETSALDTIIDGCCLAYNRTRNWSRRRDHSRSRDDPRSRLYGCCG